MRFAWLERRWLCTFDAESCDMMAGAWLAKQKAESEHAEDGDEHGAFQRVGFTIDRHIPRGEDG